LNFIDFSLIRDKFRMQKKIVTQPREQKRAQAATNPALTLALRNQAKGKQRKRRPNKKKNQPTKGSVNELTNYHRNPHPCTAGYASALADPEHTPQGACIPWGFPVPSQRIKTFTRGFFACGTTGKGYILFNPTLGNDSLTLTFTNTTSVGTNATALSAFTNRTDVGMTKLPYTIAQLNGQLTGRLVASVLKVRYAGTEANRNGVVTTYERPAVMATNLNSSTFDGTIGIAMTSLNERPSPIGDWACVKYSGPYSSFYTQFDTATAWAAVGALMVCYVQGVASDLYEFECFAHYEFAGPTIPGESVTHSDPEGFGQASQAMKSHTTSGPLNDINAPSAFTAFMRSAGSSISTFVKEYGMPLALEYIAPAFLPGSGSSLKLLTG
jgi:hypothetical protein